MESLGSQFQRIKGHIVDVNLRFERLLGSDHIFFDDITVPEPRFEKAMETFVMSISWMFVLYCESGDESISFLLQQKNFVFSPRLQEMRQHIELEIPYLRTYFQHNLPLGGKRQTKSNKIKTLYCNSWFDDRKETYAIFSEEACCIYLVDLLGHCEEFLMELISALDEIDQFNEGKMLISEGWLLKSAKNKPFVFEPIVNHVLENLGMHAVDSTKLCKDHCSTWNSRLSVLRSGYDFQKEVQPLVEETLIKYFNSERITLPINGDDLINELGIPKGIGVKNALIVAKEIFSKGYLTRDALLKAVKSHLDAHTG